MIHLIILWVINVTLIIKVAIYYNYTGYRFIHYINML